MMMLRKSSLCFVQFLFDVDIDPFLTASWWWGMEMAG